MKKQKRNLYATKIDKLPPVRPQPAAPSARPLPPQRPPERRSSRAVYATKIDASQLPLLPRAERPRPVQPGAASAPPGARRSARTLVKASLIIMLAVVASRLLGLGRELVVSYLFGTSRVLDAYQAAFRIPDLIFQIVAAGAMGAAFIPVFTEYLTRNEEDDAWRMAGTVLNAAFVILAVSATLAALFANQLAALVAPGFDAEARALTANLMRIMLIQALLAGISGLVTAILHSYNDFLLPALAPIVYNVSIITGALVLATRPEFGIYGLAIGVAVGGALHLLIQLPGLRRPGARYRLGMDVKNAGARRVGVLMLPRIAGLGALQVNFLANTIIASRLVEGSIAALNYAFQLVMLPWGVFASAISTAVFPTLSQQAALDRRSELVRIFSSSLRVILYLTIPAGIGMLVLREPLIRLLFQRGQFTAESSAMTAHALMFYAPGLFAIAATEIITRTFHALQDTRTPVLIGVCMVITNITLSLILGPRMGVGGLALAYSIANGAETVVLLAIMQRRLGGIDGPHILSSLLRVLVAAVIMGEGLSLGVFAAGDLLVTAPLLVRLLVLTLLIATGALIYLLLTIWLGSEEITGLAQRRAEK